MPSFSVIVHPYELKDFCLRIFPVLKSTILQQFCFEVAETRLHKRIIL
jgi:hypothetical protein